MRSGRFVEGDPWRVPELYEDSGSYGIDGHIFDVLLVVLLGRHILKFDRKDKQTSFLWHFMGLFNNSYLYILYNIFTVYLYVYLYSNTIYIYICALQRPAGVSRGIAQPTCPLHAQRAVSGLSVNHEPWTNNVEKRSQYRSGQGSHENDDSMTKRMMCWTCNPSIST